MSRIAERFKEWRAKGEKRECVVRVEEKKGLGFVRWFRQIEPECEANRRPIPGFLRVADEKREVDVRVKRTAKGSALERIARAEAEGWRGEQRCVRSLKGE